jgi:hypothetical protein
MTTSEARFILTPYDQTRDRIRDTETKDCDYIDTMAEACDRLNELAAALAASEAARERAERERDALIEAWPEIYDDGTVVEMMDGSWSVREDEMLVGTHATRADAVRAAANLDAATRTEQPAQGEGE